MQKMIKLFIAGTMALSVCGGVGAHHGHHGGSFGGIGHHGGSHFGGHHHGGHHHGGGLLGGGYRHRSSIFPFYPGAFYNSYPGYGSYPGSYGYSNNYWGYPNDYSDYPSNYSNYPNNYSSYPNTPRYSDYYPSEYYFNAPANYYIAPGTVPGNTGFGCQALDKDNCSDTVNCGWDYRVNVCTMM